MPIIDTHVHDVPLLKKLPVLFDRLAGSLPAGDGREASGLDELPADMDRVGVAVSLVVLYTYEEEFLRLAGANPGRLFGLAYYDSLHPAESLERIQTLAAERPDLLVGISTAFPYFHQDPRLGEFRPLYDYCERRRLPIQFHTGGDPTMEAVSRPAVFGELARAHPRLPVICLHAGGSGFQEIPAYLQQIPNLFLEVEGLQETDLSGDGRPRVLWEILRSAPSRKVMFGSNRMHRNGPYAARVQAVRTLPAPQREDVCWQTAAAVYGPRLLGHQAAVLLAHSASR